MSPRIEILHEKKLIGKRLTMSLTENRTAELWKSFMPHRRKIPNIMGTDLFSLQVYDSPSYFTEFNPYAEFEKWAAVEVSDYLTIPEGMEKHVLKGGLYAVFLHVGSSSEFEKTFQFIFGYWMPNSEYELDNRDHFELLGEKYKNNDPDSEEEIWIPIRKKQ